MTPSAICFDATGTLIETAEEVGQVYHRVARQYGVDLPAWRLEDAFRRILRRAPARGIEGSSFETRCDNEIKWWFERIRETFQATDSTARFEEFPAFAKTLFETYRSRGAWRLRPGALEMLTELQRRALPMAVVSNFDHRLPEILEALDISSFFGSIVIPATVGCAKPDRVVFDAVTEQLSLPPNSLDTLVYVGDDPKETLLAIAGLGLRVIDMREIEDLDTLPDRLVRAAILPPRQTQD